MKWRTSNASQLLGDGQVVSSAIFWPSTEISKVPTLSSCNTRKVSGPCKGEDCNCISSQIELRDIKRSFIRKEMRQWLMGQNEGGDWWWRKAREGVIYAWQASTQLLSISYCKSSCLLPWSHCCSSDNMQPHTLLAPDCFASPVTASIT